MVDDTDRFLDLACLTYLGNDAAARRREAEDLLHKNPELPLSRVHVAAAVGDVASLRALLDQKHEPVKAAGGPRGWTALLYLCYSRVTPERAGWDPVAAARLLLERGADPNSATTITDSRFSAITGAIGGGETGLVAQPPHRQARALVELLLDAGADPNDSQALYNTHFVPDDSWLRLLLDRGLSARQPINWNDRRDERILDYLLGQAARQGFTDRVRLLLEHGAEAGGRNHYNRRTHLENARLNGHVAIASLLEQHGAADAPLGPDEQFQAACLAGDETAARRLLAESPAASARPEVLAAGCEHGRLTAVRLALDLGVAIDAVDSEGLTPLHRAARAGHPDVVRELVTRGANMSLRDSVYGGTPLNHADYFLAQWPSAGRREARDYLASFAPDRS